MNGDVPTESSAGLAGAAAADSEGVPEYAPWWQLLLANLYDWLALIGLLFVATAPWAMLSSGDAVSAGSLAFQLYLLALINAYFCFSWWRGGHTLGMRPWRVQLRQADGALPTVAQCQVRFWVAVLSWAVAGLGLVWQLGGKGTWHDIASSTRAVKVIIHTKPRAKA
ncbi:MAG: RDD family protein [Pseudomonadota bacterium]